MSLFHHNHAIPSKRETATDKHLTHGEVSPYIKTLAEKLRKAEEILEENPSSEEVNQTEIRFLQYGLDFVEYARKHYHHKLTVAEKDIDIVEDVAGQACRGYTAKQLKGEELESVANMLAGYIGLLILTHKGGSWTSETPEIKEPHPSIAINGGHYLILDKVYRRIFTGNENNLVDYYRAIEY